MKIGFIGLGNMGSPMAANLAKAGFEVFGFDIEEKSISNFTIVNNIEDAIIGMNVVITMLSDGNIVKEVSQEIISNLTKRKTFIDCSTIDVKTAIHVGKNCKKFNINFIDAPVSGGINGAIEGALTFMTGGTQEAFSIAKPLFEVMGNKTVHCGKIGSGQVAKICNNMILGSTMIATCETIAMADKLGLDRDKLFDVVSTSSGFSWSMNNYCPAPGIGPKSPADNNYNPGFASELMLKDLTLAQQAAKSVDADTPMGELALKVYNEFVNNEDGKGIDFSGILPRFEKRSRNKNS